MEARFGHDFSRVRIHADAGAAAAARAAGAAAYTLGPDITFAAGRYDPGSPAGRALLAHELAHVVQQRDGHLGVQRAAAAQAVLAPIQGLSMYALLQRLSALDAGVLADEEAGALVGGPRLVTAMRAARARRDRDPEFTVNNRQAIQALPADQAADIVRFLAEPEPRTNQAAVAPARTRSVADMSPTEKLAKALDYARSSRDDAWNQQIEALKSPESIFAIASIAGAFIASQTIPVTWVADAALLFVVSVGGFFTGVNAASFVLDVARYFAAVVATDEPQLRASGEALARAVAVFGVTVIAGALTEGFVAGVKSMPRGGPPPTALAEAPGGGVVRVRVPQDLAAPAAAPSAPRIPPALQSRGGGGRDPAGPSADGAKGPGSAWARLAERIEALGDEPRMDRLRRIDPSTEKGKAELAQLEREVWVAEEGPAGQSARAPEPGLSDRPTPGGRQPRRFERGNFAHRWLEVLRDKLTTKDIPPRFAEEVRSGKIISVDKMPDGLRAEVELGDTARADRVGHVIYEVKPNTEESIAAGLKRVDEYARLASSRKLDGRTDWVGVVVVYDAAAAATYIP
jgi:hypothetical protein